MVHRKKPVEDTLEFKKAKQFCFQHSKFDAKLQERIFVSTPEDVVTFARIAVPNAHFAETSQNESSCAFSTLLKTHEKIDSSPRT
jgi:hypothetical protein